MTAEPWDDARFRADVQDVLDTFVSAQAEALVDLGPDARRLTDAASAAVHGGKRFRAMFCHWGFRAVRPPADDAETRGLLRATASLELLHASALVHDDFMDASDTRRGHPAAHKAFEAEAREAGWPGQPEQYGAAAAILLGDLLLSWADELLRGCGLEGARVLDALRVFDLTRTEVVTGQFLDVSVQARGESDVDQAMRVLRYKSAKYSVERPLHVGAALAGGDEAVHTALTAYGVPLGEAFQLRDDLLGVFGDPEETGKPAGDDLAEGKRTVLVALALEGADPEDARRLDDALGRPLADEEVTRLQRLIERTGAPAQVEKRIEGLTADALRALADGPFTDEARGRLTDLARAATQRAV
ncbi:polyprenyl synthetase family protein [Nocardioides marmoribigeumensis]|uniref:Geranylgeranyl diphosphate synthase type I n=1 Tax=Nocardioides marmoribigeumensis TaxID=433649 RepID=A0ABU2BTH2_9ACTN|nr:polyprenyl synthetase family protein [Nocardioides marmoribigeumensis]MDR7361304.1 geranylgeranyl diphosphate synthase type I [Nocardioides marmoribigeumensis]